jgi:hypothetical protein
MWLIVVNLKRFVFCLTRGHTEDYFAGKRAIDGAAPLSIMQNAEGGGSIAITGQAFNTIGGMDESFVGWGGEDNEFWDRACTLRVWTFGSLPFIHLWHSAQPDKQVQDSVTKRHLNERLRVPVAQRIAEIRALPRGSERGPNGHEPTILAPVMSP